MSKFIIYTEIIDIYCIFGGFIFFILFLLYIVATRTASGEASYSITNKVHFRGLLLYILTLTISATLLDKLSTNFIKSVAIGAFIYTSLHYVYIFAAIGLCQKSISTRILVLAHNIEKSGKRITKSILVHQMENSGVGVDDIRTTRLQQMTILGLAKTDGEYVTITALGRIANRISEKFLKAYHLERL